MKKVINILFTAFIIVVLVALAISAPVLYGAHNMSGDSSSNNSAVGNMPTPERTFDGAGSTFFSTLDKIRYHIDYIYLNYLPFSINTVNNYNKFAEKINKPAYYFLEIFNKPKNDHRTEPETGPTDDKRTTEYLMVPSDTKVSDYKIEYVKSAGEYSYYLVTLSLDNGDNVEYYEKVSITPTNTLESVMKSQLAEINRIAASDTNVNFVVYIPTSFQMSENFDYYYHQYSENQLSGLLSEYLSGLDSSVSSGNLSLNTLADRANLGYLTDHHWSSEGVYKGYTDIIKLFRKESNDILPAVYQPQKLLKVTPCKFYGSFAREIANDSRWDNFVIYDYSLPEHRAFFGGKNVYEVSDRIKLLADADVKTLNSNAYGTFYPQITSVSYPENKTGRNLLILGDSYTRSITELVASSFDNTYSYYYCDYSYRGLDYNKFIKDNNITDVLYMQYSERALFDYCGDAELDQIITTN
ncbi:MAG: hypothetical protein VB078_10030 [Clostridiaceae bacterium]|nr:hypothetical protein [Clostridiaceae bacterium]